ncbi:MAG: hypothetical protein JXR42_01755 [Gammaproteobacteria bacterium]|nr:hypothetical protein [Gammaproteobacteria bacterium]
MSSAIARMVDNHIVNLKEAVDNTKLYSGRNWKRAYMQEKEVASLSEAKNPDNQDQTNWIFTAQQEIIKDFVTNCRDATGTPNPESVDAAFTAAMARLTALQESAKASLKSLATEKGLDGEQHETTIKIAETELLYTINQSEKLLTKMRNMLRDHKVYAATQRMYELSVRSEVDDSFERGKYKARNAKDRDDAGIGKYFRKAGRVLRFQTYKVIYETRLTTDKDGNVIGIEGTLKLRGAISDESYDNIANKAMETFGPNAKLRVVNGSERQRRKLVRALVKRGFKLEDIKVRFQKVVSKEDKDYDSHPGAPDPKTQKKTITKTIDAREIFTDKELGELAQLEKEYQDKFESEQYMTKLTDTMRKDLQDADGVLARNAIPGKKEHKKEIKQQKEEGGKSIAKFIGKLEGNDSTKRAELEPFLVKQKTSKILEAYREAEGDNKKLIATSLSERVSDKIVRELNGDERKEFYSTLAPLLVQAAAEARDAEGDAEAAITAHKEYLDKAANSNKLGRKVASIIETAIASGDTALVDADGNKLARDISAVAALKASSPTTFLKLVALEIMPDKEQGVIDFATPATAAATTRQDTIKANANYLIQQDTGDGQLGRSLITNYQEFLSLRDHMLIIGASNEDIYALDTGVFEGLKEALSATDDAAAAKIARATHFIRSIMYPAVPSDGYNPVDHLQPFLHGLDNAALTALGNEMVKRDIPGEAQKLLDREAVLDLTDVVHSIQANGDATTDKQEAFLNGVFQDDLSLAQSLIVEDLKALGDAVVPRRGADGKMITTAARERIINILQAIGTEDGEDVAEKRDAFLNTALDGDVYKPAEEGADPQQLDGDVAKKEYILGSLPEAGDEDMYAELREYLTIAPQDHEEPQLD